MSKLAQQEIIDRCDDLHELLELNRMESEFLETVQVIATQGPRDRLMLGLAARCVMWIAGFRGTTFAAEIPRLRSLWLAKNEDYEDSFRRLPLFSTAIPPGDAILVRMSDKVARYQKLRAAVDDDYTNGDSGGAVGEKLEDTVADLAGYALLWIVASRLPALPPLVIA